MPTPIPTDVEDRIKMRLQHGEGLTVGEVLRKAMDALDSYDREVLAIQEGIEDLETGRTIPLRQFDQEFRSRHDIPQDA